MLFYLYILMCLLKWRAVTFIPIPSPFPLKKKRYYVTAYTSAEYQKKTARVAKRINDSDPLPHKTTPFI